MKTHVQCLSKQAIHYGLAIENVLYCYICIYIIMVQCNWNNLCKCFWLFDQFMTFCIMRTEKKLGNETEFCIETHLFEMTWSFCYITYIFSIHSLNLLFEWNRLVSVTYLFKFISSYFDNKLKSQNMFLIYLIENFKLIFIWWEYKINFMQKHLFLYFHF